MRIRSYNPDDWEAVREIYDLSKPDEMRGAVDPSAIRLLEDSPQMLDLFHESSLLVTEEEDVVTGFAGHKGSYISFLIVHPAHRRKGVASVLLRRLLETLDGPVSLSVLWENEAARRLYERFGFAIEKDFVGKFHEHDVRILRLSRALSDSRHGIFTVPYSTDFGLELVKMWRASFETAVGVVGPNPIEHQLRFLETEVLPRHDVQILIDRDTSAILAFMAATPERVDQLYVHIDHQGRGLGSLLLDRAKRASGGRLRLFTFERNVRARRFYERHGFAVIGRGFEPTWQLADIEYEWVSAGSHARDYGFPLDAVSALPENRQEPPREAVTDVD